MKILRYSSRPPRFYLFKGTTEPFGLGKGPIGEDPGLWNLAWLSLQDMFEPYEQGKPQRYLAMWVQNAVLQISAIGDTKICNKPLRAWAAVTTAKKLVGLISENLPTSAFPRSDRSWAEWLAYAETRTLHSADVIGATADYAPIKPYKVLMEESTAIEKSVRSLPEPALPVFTAAEPWHEIDFIAWLAKESSDSLIAPYTTAPILHSSKRRNEPMKTADMNRMFLAKNVYGRWKTIVKMAQSQIEVFTPYFDETLLNLLAENESLAWNQIAIITNISAENAAEMPYQLKAAKKALSRGIEVLSLDGLHAKVLLVDGAHAAIGSQNFTRRGKQNKEATVVPKTALCESEFVGVLKEWRAAAREVTPEEIDDLLAHLGQTFKRHEKIHAEMHDAVAEVLARQALRREVTAAAQAKKHAAMARKKNALLRDRLADLERESEVRLSNELFAEIKEANDGYTLRVNGGDLTDWQSKNSDGSYSPEEITRLSFYPIIFEDTNRMAFARICKRQITYLRRAVDWQDIWNLDETWTNISITFPDDRAESRNISLEVTAVTGHGHCKIDVLFNGESTVLVSDMQQAKLDPFASRVIDHFQKSKGALDDLLREVFGGFKFDCFNIRHKNALDYFDRSAKYKIRLIKKGASGIPFFVFSKQNW